MNPRHVKREFVFSILDWPRADCPLIRDFIKDDSVDYVIRKFVKDTAIDGKVILPPPHEVCEYLQRESAKIFPPDCPLDVIANAIKGKSMFFNDRR